MLYIQKLRATWKNISAFFTNKHYQWTFRLDLILLKLTSQMVLEGLVNACLLQKDSFTISEVNSEQKESRSLNS
jgi:hypothetical protein